MRKHDVDLVRKEKVCLVSKIDVGSVREKDVDLVRKEGPLRAQWKPPLPPASSAAASCPPDAVSGYSSYNSILGDI